jgi:hypothetical protein
MPERLYMRVRLIGLRRQDRAYPGGDTVATLFIPPGMTGTLATLRDDRAGVDWDYAFVHHDNKDWGEVYENLADVDVPLYQLEFLEVARERTP